jgi:signal peptidase I
MEQEMQGMKRARQIAKTLMAANKGFLCFLLGMLLIRSAVADWYGVPSASMYPTLLIGDRIFSNRLAYDLKLPFTDIVLGRIADPQRGDIVTFTSPQDGVRLVKRLIGIPGDIVEMRDETLLINGMPLTYGAADQAWGSHRMADYDGPQVIATERLPGAAHGVMWLPDRMALRSFGPMTVPAGQYLMLGDNRDDSNDSRYIGFVPRALLTGRVSRVLFSLDPQHYHLPRLQRIGTSLRAAG